MADKKEAQLNWISFIKWKWIFRDKIIGSANSKRKINNRK